MAVGYHNGGMIGQMNITPLTGVMLILLIVLMATATILVPEPSPPVDLPAAASSEIIAGERGEIVVAVDRDGALFVDEQPVGAEEFTRALLDASRRLAADRKVVLVRADLEAPYGRIIWIMDSARLAGLRHIALATRRPDE